MPRAKANPTEDTTIVAPSFGDSDALVQTLVQKAYDFQSEKDTLYKMIQANRRSLRDLDSQGILTADQSRWLNEFYSPRKMGTENENGEVTDSAA